MAGVRETVVITGSSGYIGRTLAAELIDRFTVVGLDTVLPDTPADFETRQVDLTSDASVRLALDWLHQHHGSRIASVIHLAAFYDLSGEPNPKYEAVTVRGTERLLRGLQAFKVGQFLFASTLLVHAPCAPGERIDEDWPLQPKWPYPQSKVDTERQILTQRGDIPVVLLRLAGTYDDWCHAAFLAQQIARIRERRLLGHLFPGEIGHGQPYLHLDDLIDAVVRIIDRRDRLPPETTLLLGEPETLSYQEVQERVGELIHGEPWETRQIPKAMAKTGAWVEAELLDEDPFIRPWMVDVADDHYALDIGRAERLLGWRPRHRLRRDLAVMIERLKQDPVRWYQTNKLNAALAAAAIPAEAPPDEAELERGFDAWLQERRLRTNWAHLANIALAAWLIVSPFVLGLFDPVAAPPPPAAGHVLPPAELRNWALAASDIASGLLIALFAGLSLSDRHRRAPWATAAVGCWLLVAPLAAWTPSAAAFANDTLVGSLVVAFAVLIPPPPGIGAEAQMDATDTPAGWSYSPSTYLQRVPIVALAFAGLFVSRYLTAYQLGHIPDAWDPFFGSGTEVIVTSAVSKAWPIPDAGVGEVTYLLEILTGIVGDSRRWRTMPWLVLIFGLLIVPLGVVSIFFIIIQPIVIGTYCSLCLFAAAAMVIMIPYSVDELVATGQFLLHSRRAGKPLWPRLLHGGTLPGGGHDRTAGLWRPFGKVARDFVAGGVTFPWTLVASTCLGLWLMATRLVLGTEGAMADSDHLIGCLVVTVSVTAFGEITRPARFLNLPLGAWLIAAPFLLPGAGGVAIVASVAAGAALIGLSLPRGRLSGEHYGGWDRYIV